MGLVLFEVKNVPSKEVVESIANAREEATLGKSRGTAQERQKQKSTSHPAQFCCYCLYGEEAIDFRMRRSVIIFLLRRISHHIVMKYEGHNFMISCGRQMQSGVGRVVIVSWQELDPSRSHYPPLPYFRHLAAERPRIKIEL